MNIVITSSGKETSSAFDLRFGRAAFFCVYNEETGETHFIENENINAKGGAGTKTAEKMAELKAGKVVSGDFGPKAKDLLDKLGIQMIIMPDSDLTVQDIINKLKV